MVVVVVVMRRRRKRRRRVVVVVVVGIFRFEKLGGMWSFGLDHFESVSSWGVKKGN